MDVKEIQALHAQYASPTLTIEQARQIASMPALSGPDLGDSRRGIGFGPILRYRRHALIALAVAALAAGGGVSAARIWQVLRSQAATQPVAAPAVPATGASQSQVGTQADRDADMPINVAPPRPLSSSDFDNPANARSSGLASVDSRSLAKSAEITPATTSAQPAASHPVTDEAAAAASPIHAPVRRSATAVQPVAPTPSTASPVAEEGAPSRTQPAPARAAAVASPTPTDVQPQKPASTSAPAVTAVSTESSPARTVRPLRHVTTRHKPADQVGSDPAATPGTPAKAPAAPARASDVQLF